MSHANTVGDARLGPFDFAGLRHADLPPQRVGRAPLASPPPGMLGIL